MHEMLYEFDRAGVFELGDGMSPEDAVELVTGLPQEVVRVGLDRLLKTKTFAIQGGRLVWPRFLEAQSAKRSDRVRSAELRARRRDDAGTGVTPRDESDSSVPPVAPRDGSSHGVTEESRTVTDGHEKSRTSQNVTLSTTTPSSALLPLATTGGGGGVTHRDERMRCPMPVPVSDEVLLGIRQGNGLPPEVARAFLARWAPVQHAKASELKTLDEWCAYAVGALNRAWSADKSGMIAAAKESSSDIAERRRKTEEAARAAGEAKRREIADRAAKVGA